MENAEINNYKKHATDILLRHFGDARVQKHVNLEKLVETNVSYADTFSKQILEELAQRSISSEQLVMEQIILDIKGRMILGLFNDSQGKLNEAGAMLSGVIEEISREARQKGYTLVLSTTKKSNGCLGMIIIPIVIGVSLSHFFQ